MPALQSRALSTSPIGARRIRLSTHAILKPAKSGRVELSLPSKEAAVRILRRLSIQINCNGGSLPPGPTSAPFAKLAGPPFTTESLHRDPITINVSLQPAVWTRILERISSLSRKSTLMTSRSYLLCNRRNASLT